MKKITFVLLFVLTISQSFASEYKEQTGRKAILSELFRKQNSVGLRSFYPDMNMGIPDSAVVCGQNGERWYQYVFAFSPNMVVTEKQRWDYAWLRWEPALDREIIYYDGNGNDTTTLVYRYTNEGWEITERTMRIFNENNVEEKIYSYKKSSRDSDWKTIDTLQVVSTFVPGSPTQVASQLYYLKKGDSLILTERSDYKYENGFIQSFANFYPSNNSSDAWTPDYSYTCNRDEKGKLLFIDYFQWDDETNEYQDVWESRETFYYPGGTDIRPIGSSDIKIWSYNQMIYINSHSDLASVSIYNIAGQLLYNQSAKGNVITMESPFKRGVYIVKVREVNGKSKTTKLIIH